MSEDASWEDIKKNALAKMSRDDITRFWVLYEKQRQGTAIVKHTHTSDNLRKYLNPALKPLIEPRDPSVLILTDEDRKFLADLKVGV